MKIKIRRWSEDSVAYFVTGVFSGFVATLYFVVGVLFPGYAEKAIEGSAGFIAVISCFLYWLAHMLLKEAVKWMNTYEVEVKEVQK